MPTFETAHQLQVSVAQQKKEPVIAVAGRSPQ